MVCISRKQCIRPALLAALLLLPVIEARALSGQSVVGSPPGRYLVLYRNGQIPGDAESRTLSVGAVLSHRSELFGIAVLDGLDDSGHRKLQLDPNVEAIVPDMLIQGQALQVRAVPHAALPHQQAGQTFPEVFRGSRAPVRRSGADSLYYSPQGWAVRQVGGFGADGPASSTHGPWDTTKGKGVRIAVLDTGIDPNHPDLAPNLVLNLSEIVPSALLSPCDDGSPVDQVGHGTWAASLAAGALGPGTGLMAGVAPEAQILNIKVLQRTPAAITPGDPKGCLNGQGAGLMSWVIHGIEDAVSHHAQVISMSFGTLVDLTKGEGAGIQAIFNRATSAAYQAGAVLVAAAGNDAYNAGAGTAGELPAQSRNVLAIVASTNPYCSQDLEPGAVCKKGPVTLPYYSNYGAALNALAAPGGSYPVAGALDPVDAEELVSGWVTGACTPGATTPSSGLQAPAPQAFGCFSLGQVSYIQAMGTSASAPLAAGAAALLFSAYPEWPPDKVLEALRSSALPLTEVMPAGQINVAKLFPLRQNRPVAESTARRRRK